MWDSKGCGVKCYKAKKALGPKVRPSEEPTTSLAKHKIKNLGEGVMVDTVEV